MKSNKSTKKVSKIPIQGAFGFNDAMKSMGGLAEMYNDPANMGIKSTPKQVHKQLLVENKMTKTQNQIKSNQTIKTQPSQQHTPNLLPQEEYKSDINVQNHQQLNNKPSDIITFQPIQLTSIQLPNQIPKVLQKYASIIQSEQDPIFKNHYISIIQNIQNDDINLPIFNFDDTKLQELDINEINNNCQQANVNYMDDKFQPHNISISPINPPQYIWMRANLIYDQCQLFGDIRPESIIQGNLGDCYLISSISVLTEKEKNIKRLFQNQQMNQNGAYGIWVCDSGKWHRIIVDDMLPTLNSHLVFAKGKENQMWVPLLEKAYAKQYLFYNNIIWGYSSDALRDLTGAPTEYIDIKNDENLAWEKMKEAVIKNFVLTVSSKANSKEMTSKHCYSVINIWESADGKQKFIKIRNPQGHTFETSYNKQNHQQISQMIGEDVVQPGGIQWFHITDFRIHFEVVTSCRIHEDYNYSSIGFKKNHAIVYVTVAQENHIYFSVHQKHERYIKIYDKNYRYPTQRIIIGRLENNKLVYTEGGDFNCNQSSFSELHLKRGQYIIFAEIDSKNAEQIVVSSYSKHPVCLKSMEKVYKYFTPNLGLFASTLVSNYVSFNNEANKQQFQTKDYQDADNLIVQRKYGTLFGYAFVSYINNTQQSTLFETIEEFAVFDNLSIYYPPHNVPFNIESASQTTQTPVLLKIGSKNNCSHKMSFKSKSNFIVQQSMDSLIQKTLEEGAQKKHEPVTLYTLKFSKGFLIVYQNPTQNVYNETITFKVLDNLKIKTGRGEVSGKTVKIQVQPCNTNWIMLEFKNISNTASKYSMSYIQ